MLTQLQIRDFAIVESVELDLEPGFTALTGETGAGKSILVDALLLAVGARADSGAVRHGAKRAEVAACFDVSGNPAASAWLEEQAIDHEGECILRRVVGSDGRSRAFVNGRPVPAQLLRELGSKLVDVHGQLEFQSLGRRAHQRSLLDEFGDLGDQARSVAEAYKTWKRIRDERAALEQKAHDRDARLELLSHYAGELESLDAKTGEAESLEHERRRIGSLGKLAEGTGQVDRLLSDDDGVIAALARAQSILARLGDLDPDLQANNALIEEASIACNEAASNLRRYADGLEADPARQEWIEARLAALEAVARKHRVEIDELPAVLERLTSEHEQLANAATSLVKLDARLAGAAEEYEKLAGALSKARRKAGLKLDRQVGALMQELGMSGGLLETRVGTGDPVEFSESGNDRVEFLVSANPGQPLRPLAKVASGGELSRISLAMQVATKNTAHLPCLVFDEVDAGVGGAVAEMVGRQLRDLADFGQVLSVTHLPQVAAQANHQVRVSKHSERNVTRTALEPLDANARVDEIARMLGGARITRRTREHASEMLEAAHAGRRAPARPRRTTSAAGGAGSSRARSDRAT